MTGPLDQAREALLLARRHLDVALLAVDRARDATPVKPAFDETLFRRLWADGARPTEISARFGWKSPKSVYDSAEALDLPKRRFRRGRLPESERRSLAAGPISAPLTAPMRVAPADEHPASRFDARKSARPAPVTDHIPAAPRPDAAAGPAPIDAIYKFLRERDADIVPLGRGCWLLNGRRKITAEELREIANRKRALLNLPPFNAEWPEDLRVREFPK